MRPNQVNEFARVILGKALQLIIQLEENTPVGVTLERMSNQVSKEITVFDAFTELNSSAIRKVWVGNAIAARGRSCWHHFSLCYDSYRINIAIISQLLVASC